MMIQVSLWHDKGDLYGLSYVYAGTPKAIEVSQEDWTAYLAAEAAWRTWQDKLRMMWNAQKP